MSPRTWQIFPAIAVVLLAGCASEAERRDASAAASSAWSDCIMRAVMRLDDGKTDPASMAFGITPQCATEYNRLTEAMMSGMTTERSQAFMRQKMATDEVRLATTAILTYRAARRSPQSK